MDPEKFFPVVRDDGRRRHSFKLFKRKYSLDVGRLTGLRIGCARSGTGWIMMWLRGGVSECI